MSVGHVGKSPSSEAACGYKEGRHDHGAQTERRGVSRPVRLLLGGEGPPAALFPLSHPLSAPGAAGAGSVGYNGLTGATGLSGGPVVPITVAATYENGILQPAHPHPLH